MARVSQLNAPQKRRAKISRASGSCKAHAQKSAGEANLHDDAADVHSGHRDLLAEGQAIDNGQGVAGQEYGASVACHTLALY